MEPHRKRLWRRIGFKQTETRCWAGFHVCERCRLPRPFGNLGSVRIKNNGEDNHSAGDHLTDKISYANQNQAVGEHADQTCAEKSTDKRSAPSIEACATDNNCSDRVKLKARAEDWAGNS